MRKPLQSLFEASVRDVFPERADLVCAAIVSTSVPGVVQCYRDLPEHGGDLAESARAAVPSLGRARLGPARVQDVD